MDSFWQGFEKRAVVARMKGVTSGLRSFSPGGGGKSYGPRAASNIAIGARSKPPPLPTPTYNKGTKHLPAKMRSTKMKPPTPPEKLLKMQSSQGTPTTAL